MKINAKWHKANKMPTRLPAPKRSDGGSENPTLDQRLDWYVEHAKNCQYWPIPPKLQEEIEKRNSS